MTKSNMVLPGTSSSLSQEAVENTSDSDETYDESTPQSLSQCELNNLVRNLNLPKDAPELLCSRLKEKNLLGTMSFD